MRSEKGDHVKTVVVLTEDPRFWPLPPAGSFDIVDCWTERQPGSFELVRREVVSRVVAPTAVIFWSVTPFLFREAHGAVARGLVSLAKTPGVCKVIAACLFECHPDLQHFRKIFQSTVRLERGEDDRTILANSACRSDSGKGSRTVEILSVENGRLKKLGERRPEKSLKCTGLDNAEAATAPSMDQWSSFSLSLTAEEKGERAKLVLPYVKTRERDDDEEVRVNVHKKSEGKIYYEPDEADDWDEEDPDDDLDF